MIIDKLITALLDFVSPEEPNGTEDHQANAALLLSTSQSFAPSIVAANLSDYLDAVSVGLNGYTYTFQLVEIKPASEGDPPVKKMKFTWKLLKIEKQISTSEVVFETAP